MGPRQQEEEEEEGASWPNNGIMDQRLSRARPPFWAGSSKSSGETRDLQDSIKCTLSRQHYIRKNSETEFVVQQNAA